MTCCLTEDLLLQEDLIQMLPMVNEANAMSEELNKRVKFELALVSPQARGLTEGSTEVKSNTQNRIFSQPSPSTSSYVINKEAAFNADRYGSFPWVAKPRLSFLGLMGKLGKQLNTWGSFHKVILATIDLSYLRLILRLPALIFTSVP